MGKLRKGLPGALAVALVAASSPSAAVAGTGGTTAPAGGGATPVGGTNATTGGSTPTATTPAPAAGGGGSTFDPNAPQQKSSSGKRPVLTSFDVGAGRFFDLGRPARVRFRIDSRAKTVHVKLEIRQAGKRIRLLDLGDRATGRSNAFDLTGREQGVLPEGELQLRLTARDARGRGLSPTSRATSTDALGFYWHRFPLGGAFNYGGEAARFGAGRDGHIHQGQDLMAPEGTAVFAPRAGTITTVDYQAGGAGNYIVMRAEGENRSYVFMHLRDGSTSVAEGQTVRTGDRIASVGTTGASSGPHLHFEIWDGAWQAGGHALDPLADLKAWGRWS